MNKKSLLSAIKTNRLAQEIHFFNETDSTNSQAKTIAQNTQSKEGSIIIAQRQKQGRGTDGNPWHSDDGNLYFSIIFKNMEKINTLFPLYPAVALAQMLREDYDIEAHVKWPNDVLIGRKKIAGILCEGVAGKSMIMGMGININQEAFPKELQNIATSMKKESHHSYQIETVLNAFLIKYEDLYYSETDIRQEWLKHTHMIGRTITSTQNGIEKKAQVCGMSSEGFLEIKDKDGHKESWMARRGLDISTNY